MQYSCGQFVSFVILLAATACIIGSIATDYWDYRSLGSDTGLGGYKTYRGLIRGCSESQVGAGLLKKKDCYYRFDVDITEGNVDVSHKGVETWEIAVLALMGASAVVSILSLLFSPCCCNRCGCVLTFWVLLATLCTAAGVGLYGYKSVAGESKILKIEINLQENNNMMFGWSFWLAVGGGVLQLLATLGFGVTRARQHSYSHTI